jgi:hypothetical protein
MGRASNAKWRARLQRWLRATTVAEKDRLQELFGRHRRFHLLRLK